MPASGNTRYNKYIGDTDTFYVPALEILGTFSTMVMGILFMF